jgi:hypothetical protein
LGDCAGGDCADVADAAATKASIKPALKLTRH